MRRLFALSFFASISLFGAEDPVKWTLTLDPAAAPPGSHVAAKFAAKIDSGWHLYSLTTPKGGPIPTTSGLAESPVVASFKILQPKPVRKLDPNCCCSISN
jgi:thiol:disulfide interchange protein DsbD